MKSEQLLDAIGMLDEDLILEAEEKPARRKVPVWQIASAAAAAVVVCAGLYLLPAMQPAGTAAPESQGTDNALADVAGGVLADGNYEYMTDGDYTHRVTQSKNTEPEATKDVAGATQGVFEPVFRTEQGRYMLVGEELPIKSKLPEGVLPLGELVLTAPDEPVYPSVGTKELVGLPVWQSVDGECLYIQTSDGQWLQATRCR